jgi:hypothetical protein
MFTSDQIDGLSMADLAALERNEASTPADHGWRELQASAIGLDLRSVQIMDGLQGTFGFGKATGVYLITTVVDGTSTEPIVFEGKTYQNIENGDMLPLGPSHDPNAAFNIYLREGQVPRLLSFQLLVLRSNAGIRQFAAVFSQVRNDQRYTQLSDIVKTAVSAANPALSTVFQAANELIGLFGDYLQSRPDDQLAYYEARYTNAFHNLGIGRHPVDQRTMPVGKIRFSYEINAIQ